MPAIQCNGADLYYEEHGVGPPIVFLHGASAGVRYFEPQLTDLSDYRRVAFDFRGHGRSEKTAVGHTMGQYARDVQAVFEALGLEEVVLVGWSMGASVSWEYVDAFGTDRIRALIDVDMEPAPMQREGYDHGSYSRADLAAAYEAIQTDPTGVVEDSLEALLGAPPSRKTRTMMLDEGTRTPAHIQAAMLVELPTVDHREVLGPSTCRCWSAAGPTRRGVASPRWRPSPSWCRTLESSASKRAAIVRPFRSQRNSIGARRVRRIAGLSERHRGDGPIRARTARRVRRLRRGRSPRRCGRGPRGRSRGASP